MLSYNIYIIMLKTFVIDLIFYRRFFLLVTRRCTILFKEEVVVQEKVTWWASRLDNSIALQMRKNSSFDHFEYNRFDLEGLPPVIGWVQNKERENNTTMRFY